jgi:hypothetical protein
MHYQCMYYNKDQAPSCISYPLFGYHVYALWFLCSKDYCIIWRSSRCLTMTAPDEIIPDTHNAH